MYDLVLQLLIFSSLGAIIFIFARAVPRVTEGEGATHPVGFWDNLLRHLPLSKIDGTLNSFFEKFLRRSKVVLSRLDNLVTSYLNRVRKTSHFYKNSSAPDSKDLPRVSESGEETKKDV